MTLSKGLTVAVKAIDSATNEQIASDLYNVERPVKPGGLLIATILSGSDHQNSIWQDVAPIAEDGTFKFAALPRDSHVELIAVCDGWVSRCIPETAADYDQKHGTAFAQMNVVRLVTSTPFRLESDAANVIVNMEETGICKFKVVDEHDDPVDLATVVLMPNQTTRAGSTFLGVGGRSIDTLRKPDSVSTKADANSYDFATMYTRVTNPQGIAVISNLPAGSQMIMVDHPDHVVVPDPDYPTMGSPNLTATDIEAVGLEKKVVRIRKGNNVFSGLHWNVQTADGISQIKLRIVDEDGVSLPNAKINLMSQSITNPGEKKPWPAEWPKDVTLHGHDFAVIRVPRPNKVPVEDLAKASIWIDIEADGCVPLKNHEVSLSQRLPIRLQAVDQKPE